MIDKNKVKDFIDQQKYDIRKTKNGRFMDQKCIPDVLNAVAECVLEYIKDDVSTTFTKDNIWHNTFSRQLLEDCFRKPDTENDTMGSEYDKFFAQPLKLLASAGVLDECKEKNTNVYKVKNVDILEFISAREQNALFFLDLYLTKVVKDSGLYIFFEEFFRKQNRKSYNELREALINFYNKYTPINGSLEPPRIFNKIINILAFSRKKYGCVRGQLSKAPLTIDEIRYNRVNWRDISKSKVQSRQEYAKTIDSTINSNVKYYERAVENAKKYVRQLEPYSEVHRYSQYKTTEAHHIFMKSDYPELADMPENIIALTGTQHYSYAHPDRHTQTTSTNYQMICLISKLDSIERNFQEGHNDYSLEDFTKVLNIGLGTEEFTPTMGFEKIKARLLYHLRPYLAQDKI